MKLIQLVAAIHSVHDATRAQAAQSVNAALTIRNWLTGHYIVEFEQKGDDRAKYGGRLLETLSRKLQDDGMKGMSATALKLFREFYRAYPQIGQTLSDQFTSLLLKSPLVLPLPQNNMSIRQTPSDHSLVEPRLLLNRLSFSHFVELLKVEHLLKKSFYESHSIKGKWVVREMKRKIGSLLFERITRGLATIY